MSIAKHLFLALIVAGLTAIAAQAQTAPAVDTISAEELKAKVTGNQPVMIIDVRSSSGFAASATKVKGAIHFKVRKLRSRLGFAPLKDLPKDRETVTYCACPKDEVLLAVIHGFGANEWRDPEATQTFVLKNVAGNDLKVHTGEEFVTANSGRKLPSPKGDLIAGTLQGNLGYLYYASANYSWYDPKTFKGTETPPGVFHKSRTMR